MTFKIFKTFKINSCGSFKNYLNIKGQQFHSAIKENPTIESVVKAFAHYQFEAVKAYVSHNQCVQCRTDMEQRSVVRLNSVCQLFKDDLQGIYKAINAMSEKLRNGKDEKTNEVTSATALFQMGLVALSQAPQFKLPVWSLEGGKAKHHLVGTCHFGMQNMFLPNSPLIKAIECSKIFIAESINKMELQNAHQITMALGCLCTDFVIWTGIKMVQQSDSSIQMRELDSPQQREKFCGEGEKFCGEGDKMSGTVGGAHEVYLVYARQMLAVHLHDFKSLEPTGKFKNEKFKKILFNDREERWIKNKGLIKTLKESKEPVCVYVGAAHFVRKGGLLEKFAEAGLKAKLLTK